VPDFLSDKNNLTILEELVSGNAVGVNLSELSRVLGHHRHTIMGRVQALMEHGILDIPYVPFVGLGKVYPLFVILYLEAPDDPRFERWIKEDPYIFAAFRTRQSDYNTLLFVYHQDLTSYLRWRESLPSIMRTEYDIPEELTSFLSSSFYHSNELTIKHEPSSGLALMIEEASRNGNRDLNGLFLNELDFEILKCLTSGVGLKINEALLCKKTGLHRKTVEKRIASMVQEGYISSPVCTFPNYYVPPDCIMTLSLVEVRKQWEKVIREVMADPHIPVALRTVQGRYNLLMIGNHYSIGEYLQWDEEYRGRFPGAFGGANVTYLTPRMTIFFSYRIVPLMFIRKRMEMYKGRKLRELLNPTR
jgi:DNA-binding Lrp family transcriptional regulator